MANDQFNLFARAIRLNNFNVAKENFKEEFLNRKDDDGYYPIHLACMNNSVDIFKFFKNQNCNTDLLDANGNRPIQCAIKSGSVEIVEILLNCQDSIYVENELVEFTKTVYSKQMEILMMVLRSRGHDDAIRENSNQVQEYANKIMGLMNFRHTVPELEVIEDPISDPINLEDATMLPSGSENRDLQSVLGTSVARSSSPRPRSSNTMKKSLFIIIEGLDRSGKSTQVINLCNHLIKMKYKVKMVRFPNRETEIGKIINSYLKKENIADDHFIHLLFTANRWESIPGIVNVLDKQEIVICDRYSFSGIAYSAAKENMDFKWCETVEHGLPRPDIVFYMDKISKREGCGDEIYEKIEFQKRVHGNFLKLIKENPFNDKWEIIDANQPVSKIHEDIVNSIKQLL